MIREYVKWLQANGWTIKSWNGVQSMVFGDARRVIRQIRIDYTAVRPSPDELI